MSIWHDFLLAFTTRNKHLDRIATALERIAPELEPEPDPIRPEDAVQYVDEEAIARQEQIDQAGELARWLEEHPEWAEGEENVQSESD